MHELTFRDYIKILFRWKWVIILSIVSVSATVIVGLKLKTPVYASTVKMLITAQKQAEATYYRDIIDHQNTQLVLTQSEIVKSTPVVERALQAIFAYKPLSLFLSYEKDFASPLKKYMIDRRLKKINEDFKKYGFSNEKRQAYIYRAALEDLKSRIRVEPVRDTNIFQVIVTDFDPVGAAVTANIVSRSYVIFDLEQQLAEMKLKYGEKHLAVSQLRDNIDSMIQNLNGRLISDIEAIGPASVKIIEQASPSISPLGPPKRLTIVLAFLVSVFFGMILAFIFEYLDQTFKSPQDIERTLNIPYLGGIPRKAKLTAYKNLAEQLYLLMKEKGLQVIVMTASRPKEGVTTVCQNVAKYIATGMGHRVLIIDANPRHLSRRWWKIHKERCGLFEILEDKAKFADCIEDKGGKLFVLPAGKTQLNPSVLLESEKMAGIIQEARTKYEVILIDSASLNFSRDVLKILKIAEALVLIISEGSVRRQAVKAALENLNGARTKILGAVLNNRVFPIPRFIYERV